MHEYSFATQQVQYEFGTPNKALVQGYRPSHHPYVDLGLFVHTNRSSLIHEARDRQTTFGREQKKL